jgi:transposase
LPDQCVLLAEDETDVLLFPPLRATWSPRGQPTPVMLTGRNDRRVVFGAFNLRTGHRLFLLRQRQRAVDFQAFLEHLQWHYRRGSMALLLDEDSSHTAKGSLTLADFMGIRLMWLPKRCPELNPIESLWGQGKDVVSANHQYGTIDEHAKRFIDYVNSLPNEQILQLTGMRSPHFWLNRIVSKNF